jgi:hypothetical protein
VGARFEGLPMVAVAGSPRLRDGRKPGRAWAIEGARWICGMSGYPVCARGPAGTGVSASFGYSAVARPEAHGLTAMSTLRSLLCPRKAKSIGRSETMLLLATSGVGNWKQS